MTKALIEQFREIQPKFTRFYTRMLEQAGLTQPQYAVLLELLQIFPEPLTMTAISCKLHITKPAVTNLADRLEKSGFLKRVNHPKDRRISLLQLMPSGKKISEKIRSRFLEVMMSAVKPLTESEKKAISHFYSVLATRVDEDLMQKSCS